jgi:hypothetical protein
MEAEIYIYVNIINIYFRLIVTIFGGTRQFSVPG